MKADRCGSTRAAARGLVSVDGEEKFRTVTPDEELQKFCDEQAAADPEMMPYFFLQSEDYITLKERATSSAAHIDTAVETLKVAEYLQPLLQEALLK